MNRSPRDLAECNPRFLRKWGFALREQDTSDTTRLVEWVRTLDATGDDTLALAVRYEMSICDDPDASESENREWSLLGVYLKVYSAACEKRRAAAEGARPEDEDEEEFLTAGLTYATKLPVTTKSQLRSLLRLLPQPPAPRAAPKPLATAPYKPLPPFRVVMFDQFDADTGPGTVLSVHESLDEAIGAARAATEEIITECGSVEHWLGVADAGLVRDARGVVVWDSVAEYGGKG